MIAKMKILLLSHGFAEKQLRAARDVEAAVPSILEITDELFFKRTINILACIIVKLGIN
ncbi:hypothetical protein NC651_002032 [Populus alba x Populus x berolinensis]|nr:hypothetical protein NC651_002032 [Populus alba x Populus x berolinensis]